jgi:uncharacterized protein YciI
MKETDVTTDSTADDERSGGSDVPAPVKEYWVALCTPKETASQEDIAATLPTHLEWLQHIEDHNQLFMAGPLLSGPDVRMGSGIMIFRAADETEATSIANQDPFVTGGLRTLVLYRWRLNEGSVSLRVSLGQHTYDWR